MKNIFLQNNSKKDFENLFQKYSDVIYRFCLYKTSNSGVAHDLTQETFLRLWKTMSSKKTIEKPKQYIYQITRNLLVDYYKSKKYVSLDDLQTKGFDPEAENQPHEFDVDISLLKDLIEGLDEEFRDVVYMKFVEGMRVKDIAETLEISQNLVSVRISRGKKMLRQKFI